MSREASPADVLGFEVRGIKGESVGIGRLERFVGDTAIREGWANIPYIEPNRFKVGIVGSGPAGMACAADMAKAGCSIADIAAGMYAYTGVLSALLLRDKTGEGSRIDVSMLESLVEWMNYPLYYAYDGAAPPPRAGAAHATIYPYGPFAVGDGGAVMLGLQNEREWKAFCDTVLQNPALATDPRLILLDEPFAGVDPIAVIEIQRIISFLKGRGIGVLITDHNVRETLGICDRAYIISEGTVLASGVPEELVGNEQVRAVYLGENFDY